MYISNRSQQINSSGIRRVFDLAAKLKDPINLSIGVPDFDAPKELIDGACNALNSRKSGYTQTQGIEPLREKLRLKYKIDSGSDLDVFLSSGVSGGLFLSYMSILDPGDEVVIPDPFFCMYRDLALLINANPVTFNTYPSFRYDPEEIERVITPKTRAIVVNTPGNPTGTSISSEDLKGVIEIAKKHDLWIIYDELYEFFSYDKPHQSIVGMYDKVIILNGFSKSHGIPGWRAGYVVAPSKLVQAMLKIQQYTFVCTPSVTQWAIAENFDIDLGPYVDPYLEKGDLIYNGLKDKYEVMKPDGAFYVFPKAPNGDGDKFVDLCIENNLLVVPGSAFSNRNTHFRISFSAPLSVIERGVEVLRKLA